VTVQVGFRFASEFEESKAIFPQLFYFVLLEDEITATTNCDQLLTKKNKYRAER
jgi:hypothetical protein